MEQKNTYEATCVEHGDYFTFKFETTETDMVKVKEIGDDEASGWGAECLKVELVK